MLQVPDADTRAGPYKPDAVLLYTGVDRTTATDLSSTLVPAPSFTMSTIGAVQNYFTAFNASLGGSGSTIPGELLSILGLTLGTDERVLAGMYVENALQPNNTLFSLWPKGSCQAMGFSNGTTPVTFLNMINGMINVSNTPANAATLRSLIQNVVSNAGGSSTGAVAGDAMGVAMVCGAKDK